LDSGRGYGANGVPRLVYYFRPLSGGQSLRLVVHDVASVFDRVDNRLGRAGERSALPPATRHDNSEWCKGGA